MKFTVLRLLLLLCLSFSVSGLIGNFRMSSIRGKTTRVSLTKVKLVPQIAFISATGSDDQSRDDGTEEHRECRSSGTEEEDQGHPGATTSAHRRNQETTSQEVNKVYQTIINESTRVRSECRDCKEYRTCNYGHIHPLSPPLTSSTLQHSSLLSASPCESNRSILKPVTTPVVCSALLSIDTTCKSMAASADFSICPKNSSDKKCVRR